MQLKKLWLAWTFQFSILSIQMHFMLWHLWKLTLLVINENIMFDRAKKIRNGNKCCETKIGIKSQSNYLVRTKLHLFNTYVIHSRLISFLAFMYFFSTIFMKKVLNGWHIKSQMLRYLISLISVEVGINVEGVQKLPNY